MTRIAVTFIILTIALTGCSAANFGESKANDTSAQSDDTDVLNPIDPACSSSSTKIIYPPYIPLKAPVLPASCTSGFEMNNLEQKSVSIQSAGGSRSIKLAIDIGTYHKPDDIRIFAVNGSGQSKLLLHTCRMQTWDMLLIPPTVLTDHPMRLFVSSM